MSLHPGVRLGPYEVTALIGEGGMGKVWRARHTTLKRDDALKVLPDAFASDPDRLARFQREAQVLASLNHPNIAHVYGLEQADGVQALVMELVEGPTLADRIAQGPIPLDEALAIARQIAEALEAAHEQGIIHRDLKPANIKVRPDGTVKVLDFGLAKALDPIPATAVDVTASPTITSPALMTGVGMLLGTAAYMSPEQAKGRAADKRSDIWAFGCVLFEMLTGRRAFEHEDMSETLARVLMQEPDWRSLPPKTPPAIHRLLHRCLAKDRRLRLSDVAAARLDIIDAQSAPQGDIEATSRPARWRERLAWTTAGLVIVLAAGALAWALRPASPGPELRLEVATPPTTDPISLGISPDGRRLVFAATVDGRPRLWLRELGSVSPRPLPGTENGEMPFWSPDSRSLGFFVPGKLKRIDVDTGSVQELANASGGRGGTWSADGTILFTPSGTSPVVRIAATGGDTTAVTGIVSSLEGSNRFPHFLPDGRHFLYFAAGTPDTRGVYIGQLDGSSSRRLLDSDSLAVYAPSGHVFFVRKQTLFAQAFDPIRLTLGAGPFPVAEQLAMSEAIAGAAALSASAAGPVVYRTASGGGRRRLAWFDRSGKEIAQVGDAENAGINPTLSPDGRRVALQRGASDDIWIVDLGRGVPTRFTFDAAFDIYPVWSPDGSQVVFSSNRSKGGYDLYQKPVGSTRSETPVAAASPIEARLSVQGTPGRLVMDWSPDGRFLMYRAIDQKTGVDIWALPLDGGKPFPIVQTEFDERDAQFSPDGKWIAYQSNQSGSFEIYVQSFPGPGGKQQVSRDGGAQVRWRPDGKELFYVALNGQLVAVPITLPATGQSIEPGTPVPLFATHVGGAVQTAGKQQYDISPDGQRFLMSTIVDDVTSPISIILNWTPGRP